LAAFGLLLSITGTFGLASYTVSKRLRELSIRVALARREADSSAALGRMLILLARRLSRWDAARCRREPSPSAIVYQASAQDPFVLAAVALTVLLTGSLSVAGPVRRALHIDPANLLANNNSQGYAADARSPDALPEPAQPEYTDETKHSRADLQVPRSFGM